MQKEPQVHSSPTRTEVPSGSVSTSDHENTHLVGALTVQNRTAGVLLGVDAEGIHLIIPQIVIVPPPTFRPVPALCEIVQHTWWRILYSQVI